MSETRDGMHADNGAARAVVAAGGTAFPAPAEWHQVRTAMSWSDREWRVVHDLVLGLPRKRVAHLQGISTSTLQTYLRRALRKAKADTLLELVWRIVAICEEIRRASQTRR